MKEKLPRPSAVARIYAVALCGWWFCLQPAVAASSEPAESARPFVEEVWPGVVQRGETCLIELRGTGLEQATGLWTSVPGLTLAARPVSAGDGATVVLEVDVPAEAPPGLFGLRLATSSGLSNACVFLIDALDITRNEFPREQVAGQPAAVPVTLPEVLQVLWTVQTLISGRPSGSV